MDVRISQGTGKGVAHLTWNSGEKTRLDSLRYMGRIGEASWAL